MVLPENAIYKVFQNLNGINKFPITKLGGLLCRHEGLLHGIS